MCSSGQMTSNSIDRGLAAMPTQERSLRRDEPRLGGNQSYNQGQHREAMAKNTSPQGSDPRADVQPSQWHDAAWDQDHEEAACNRARRLLSKSTFHRFGDHLGALRRWLAGERWVKRLAVAIGVLMVIFAGCFGGLWWRLGAGPINLEMATPWLAAAIEQNIGHGNTVEVGGTQIERAGRIRIAVRIRDIIVRDRDHVVVATAPKAEVKLSGTALLMGQLRAESLNLVDAELAVRITPDGYVPVSTGDTERPLATGVASKRQAGGAPPLAQGTAAMPAPAAPPPPGAAPSGTAPTAPGGRDTTSGLLAGLDWLDSLSLTGLDGQNLNEIGLKNGNLIVDDQQRGNKWNFENITLSLRRPSGGGVALSVGEEGRHAWSLRVVVGPPANGVRSVDIRADKVSTTNILLALRVKDLTYSANLPLTGELKGELGRDGLPTYFRGKITAGAGIIIDSDTPDYPMAIDSAEVNVEWDAGRRVLVAPFKIISGSNRITLLAHLEPPNDAVSDWQLGLSGGTIVLAGIDPEQPPLIFNRIAIGVRFDTEKRRVLLTQADISNGEIGIAGTGNVDYSAEPRLTLGFAGTPMSASALKRMWPTLIVPEVREWVIERVERGSLQRIEVGVNSPVRYPGGTQTQHFGFCVRGAGYGAEAGTGSGKIPDGWSGAGGGGGAGTGSSQRIFRHLGRSQFEQGNGFGGGHPWSADQARTDQGRHHLCHYSRPRRICRRSPGDESKARSQRAESHRQQFWLSGQGRGQDQRASGLDGLSQADGRRCRYQIAGDTRRCQPRAPGSRSRICSQRGYSDQAGRQDRRPGSRQPLGHRCRSDLVEARQYPAGLGQAAGQVEPRRFQRGAETAVDPPRRHRDRWRRCFNQGIARG